MPDFIERDPEKIYNDIVAQYEEMAGHKLYDGQPEHLLIGLLSYRESLVRMAVQDAAMQNLVAHAREPFLDELGLLVGVHRIEAMKATVTLTITPDSAMVLPVGTKVQSKAKKIIFENQEAVNLPVSGAEVVFTASVAGASGNGLDDVTVLLSPLKGVRSITVMKQSEGGADEEDSDRLRGRIIEAPEHYSVAGPRGAYRYFAMSASSLIKDVAVGSSAPGVVDVYVLSNNNGVLELVRKVLTGDEICPLTDKVNVWNAFEKPYVIELSYKTYLWADLDAVKKGINDRIAEYAENAASKLGVDIVASQITAAVMAVPGVYSINVKKPGDAVINDNEVAVLSDTVIVFDGAVYG